MATSPREIDHHLPLTFPRDVLSPCPRSRLQSPCLLMLPSTFSTLTTTTMPRSRSSLPALAALASTTTRSSPTLALLQFHPVAPPSPTAPTAHHQTLRSPATAHPTQTAAPAPANAMASLAKASVSSSTVVAPGVVLMIALTAPATSVRAKRKRFTTLTANLAATESLSRERYLTRDECRSRGGWSSEEGRMREIRLFIPLSGQTLATWRLPVSFPKFVLFW